MDLQDCFLAAESVRVSPNHETFTRSATYSCQLSTTKSA